MADPVDFWSATQLLHAYRTKALSPVEATRSALSRIEALNGPLNAYCRLDAEGALEAARASEARWSRNEPRGLLDGVPVSIKDVLLTRGMPTLHGSRTVSPDQPWTDDAPAVARLREHGAVILGKTTTPELGHKFVTDSPLTGITRNPWNLERSPGGSSGGAAAAVAAGLGPLAVGTDGGGSIRIPATWSGIVGHKPTAGRVPTWPPSRWGALSHVGPLARSVEDAALLLTVLAGPDRRDPAALPPDGRDYRIGLEDGVAGLRDRVQPRSGAGGGRAGDRRRRGGRGPGARAAGRARGRDQAPGHRGDRAGTPHVLHGHLRPVPGGADAGAARPPGSLPAGGRRGGPGHHRGGLPRGPDDAPGRRRPDGGALRGPRSPRAARASTSRRRRCRACPTGSGARPRPSPAGRTTPASRWRASPVDSPGTAFPSACRSPGRASPTRSCCGRPAPARLPGARSARAARFGPRGHPIEQEERA